MTLVIKNQQRKKANLAANFSPKDPLIYFPFKLTKVEQEQLMLQFDINSEIDIQEIKEAIKETKFLKRVCVYKIIMHIPEYLFTRILFGKEEASYRSRSTSLYWKFLRNKIPLEKFGKEMTVLLKSGKII